MISDSDEYNLVRHNGALTDPCRPWKCSVPERRHLDAGTVIDTAYGAPIEMPRGSEVRYGQHRCALWRPRTGLLHSFIGQHHICRYILTALSPSVQSPVRKSESLGWPFAVIMSDV